MFWKNNQSKRKHIVDNEGALIRKDHQRVSDYTKPSSKKWKKPLIIIGFIIIAVLIWVGVGAFSVLGKIITKNVDGGSPFFVGEVDPNELKGEGDSRINILLIGIAGANHPGGQLADSIEVVSIDPKNKTAAMLSLPRDLRVPIQGHGQQKINAAHSLGVSKNKDGGPELMKKTVSDILDLPIHYYIRIDFSGFIKFIDALGGIKIDVTKPISDPYYPDEAMKGYSPFYIKTGIQQMNGSTALKYARSRQTTSDFDRSRRQQEIMLAVKEKALSAGVLLNPKKLSDVMNILGDHLRTDMQLNEIQRVFDIVKDLNTSEIATEVLDSSEDGPLKAINSGGYYLVPRTGNFKEVQRIAHELFSDTYLTQENAQIEILNATSKKGIAGEVSDMLKSYGYNIVKIGTNDTTLAKSKIIDYSNNQKSYTLQFLKTRFDATVEVQPKPNSSYPDMVLLVGNDYDK